MNGIDFNDFQVTISKFVRKFKEIMWRESRNRRNLIHMYATTVTDSSDIFNNWEYLNEGYTLKIAVWVLILQMTWCNHGLYALLKLL